MLYKNRKKILLDNCVLDAVMFNLTALNKLKDQFEYYVCTTVIEEVARIPDIDKEKRIRILIAFSQLEVHFIPDSIFLLDYSRLDCASLGDGLIYKTILKDDKSNMKDAIIVDTCITNDCLLLTFDNKLINLMHKKGLSTVMNFLDFKNSYIKEE